MNKVNTKHGNTLINPKNLIIQLVIFIVSTITIINLLCTALNIIQWHDEFVTLLMILSAIGLAFVLRSVTNTNILSYAVFGILISILTVLFATAIHFVAISNIKNIEIPFAIFATFIIMVFLPLNACIAYDIAEHFDLKVINDDYKLDYYTYM